MTLGLTSLWVKISRRQLIEVHIGGMGKLELGLEDGGGYYAMRVQEVAPPTNETEREREREREAQ